MCECLEMFTGRASQSNWETWIDSDGAGERERRGGDRGEAERGVGGG